MISIVMPVYNALDTLDEAFQSALRSRVPDQEIVMVDDGSTDGSWQAIQGYQAAHANVVALRHDRNRGGGTARNTGVRAARHELIFVLDSDDVLGGKNGLRDAVDIMADETLDAMATGRSVFFRRNVEDVVSSVEHKKGIAEFEDLFSSNPLNFHGNFLFRKAAFERAGGYPEHHGFDTQSFAFRLLGNNLRVLVTDHLSYFRRLPRRPSYYTREARGGNTNRNWFYIFLEYLYKFDPAVRRFILDFDYDDPIASAKGLDIFTQLQALASQRDIFSSIGLSHDDASAYEASAQSDDPTLQAWCAATDIRRNDIESCLKRLRQLGDMPNAMRVVYPLIAAWSGSRLSEAALDELRHFFGATKSRWWRTRYFLQRVDNKVRRLVRGRGSR